MPALRQAVLDVDPPGREVLAAELGEEGLERVARSARAPSRGAERGRVVVVHGFLGARLDSVDPLGDRERVWLSVRRLMAGHFGDLQLGDDGEPGGAGRPVRPGGLARRAYLPLVLHLAREWEVLPFAYDWRLGIDDAARGLATAMRSWAGGEPAHLVAHSTGGLVARRLARVAPDLWASIDQGDGRARGGRLVMLGTPNRGAYATALLLLGEERTLKGLAALDRRHDRQALRSIVAGFPGVYELLPSPLAILDDDHAELFQAGAWGDLPVRADLLVRAQRMHESLRDVDDPDRLVYVAGHGRATPHLLRVERPGRFSFRETVEGDGRVPHALGPLDGVGCYWADAGHGDLPRCGPVLEALSEILLSGGTGVLPADRPAGRDAPEAAWTPAERVDPPPGLDAGRDANPAADARRAAQIEEAMVGQYLGTTGEPAGIEIGSEPADGDGEPAVDRFEPVRLSVAWGSITELVDVDVVAVGHYQGVLPQNAELALDMAISGDMVPRILEDQTRRGLIRGDLGSVAFIPWPGGKPSRVIAVAGMGSPGTFTPHGLRRLVRSLVSTIGSLPSARTVSSVLIGSGEGTLSVQQAAFGLVRGLIDAFEGRTSRDIDQLTIVEQERGRAEEIRRALEWAIAALPDRGQERLVLDDQIIQGPGGAVSRGDALAMALAAVVSALDDPVDPADREAARRLIELIPLTEHHRRSVERELRDLRGGDESVQDVAERLQVRVRRREGDDSQDADRTPLTRMAFVGDATRGIRAAAITNTATVPERPIRTQAALIQELVAEMTKLKTAENAPRFPLLARFLTRFLLPLDFRDLLQEDHPLVVEVDREMARVHWEMLVEDVDAADDKVKPVSIRRAVARQLRTTYSPAPVPPRRRGRGLRVLLIGDPGGPARSLPGARREALSVLEVLSDREDVEVDAYIGSPGQPEGDDPDSVATLFKAVERLHSGEYDVVHYAGHGSYDAAAPETSGWLFESGTLTARELENAERLPALIVANACLSGLGSGAKEGGAQLDRQLSEAGLLPTLADQFFQRGVRDYVGTAWQVSDEGATLFARIFYERLLADDGCVGQAVLAAREALWDRQAEFGCLWAAYQHYGDPSHANVLRGRSGAGA